MLSRERLVAPDQVDRPVSSRRDDPGARVRRRSVPFPALDRGREGVLNRFLGEVEVAEDPGEDGDRAAELLAKRGGDRVYAAASPRPKLRGNPAYAPSKFMISRTSTGPYGADGILAAHSSAASFDGTSMM